MLKPAEEFRRYANQCRRMARDTPNRESKATWNRLADRLGPVRGTGRGATSARATGSQIPRREADLSARFLSRGRLSWRPRLEPLGLGAFAT